MSGNSPSRMGVREVGALLNESAQADAVGHGRPVEGIPAINGGEDVNIVHRGYNSRRQAIRQRCYVPFSSWASRPLVAL